MIIFDTETTGLVEPEATPIEKQPQIIEFAAVKLDTKTLDEIDRVEFLVNPGRPLPDKIVEITSIKDSDLQDQKPFAAYYNTLVNFFLGEWIMVAHNLAFDRDLLKFELMRMDKLTQFPWPPSHKCTVELTKHIKNLRLTLAGLHELAFDETFKGAHRAMVDVEALVRIVKWLRKDGII